MRERALANVEPISTMFVWQLNQLNDGFDFNNALLVFECIGTFLQSALSTNNCAVAITFASRVLGVLDKMLKENKGDISVFVLQIYSLLVRLNLQDYTEYFT